MPNYPNAVFPVSLGRQLAQFLARNNGGVRTQIPTHSGRLRIAVLHLCCRAALRAAVPALGGGLALDVESGLEECFRRNLASE